MTPDSACGRAKCRHSLKWHNPCSKCGCMAFEPSAAALAEGFGVLPTGSVTREVLETGRVLPSGVILPKGVEA